MFEVQTHKLIQALTKRAQEVQQKLVTLMLHNHQSINKQYHHSRLFTCLLISFPAVIMNAVLVPLQTVS